MKDSDKLFDVLGVNLETMIVRIMATDKTSDNAEAYVSMAVMRRGVEEEFFCVRLASKYKTGDKYAE